MILGKIFMEISKNQLKKIAYIITLPDLGGAQSHLYEVMTNINTYGYKPFLITGSKGWLTDRLSSAGITCYIVPDLVRPIAPVHDCKAIQQVKSILNQERPALVHCHSSKAGIVGRLAAHQCHIPSLFTAHGWAFTDGVNPLKRKLYSLIENLVAYWTDKIICVSEYDRKLGIQQLPAHKDKMVTIHNCIPDMPDCVRDWEKHPVGDVINIVVVARFSTQKKNIQVLRLLRMMLNKGLNLTITFVGDGPQLEMAKAEARYLHLEREAIFLGARTDVPKLLPRYDVFLLLSNWEGFPISILEAMRAGIPVIASDVGGVSEAVGNDIGYLITNDENDLVNIIQSLDENKNEFQKLGNNARKKYCTKYTSLFMMRNIEEIYGDVLSIK